MGGACSMYGKGSNLKRVLDGKPERRLFGRPKYRWEDKIEMDLNKIIWEGFDWINLLQDRHQQQAVGTQ